MEQKRIIATDDTIHEIVGREIERLGLNADLNHIDVSGVTNMNRLFAGSSFNGDLSKWDVRNVRSMEEMFLLSRFNGDISSWNVRNVTDMRKMFFSMSIGLWARDMDGMFSCYGRETICNLSTWDVSNVKNMEWMFSGFRKINFAHLKNWDVRNVRNMSHMFYRTNIRDFTPLKNWQIHPSCDLKDFNDIGKIEFLPPNFHEAFKKTDFKNKIEKLARDARIAKERRKATLNFITVSK